MLTLQILSLCDSKYAQNAENIKKNAAHEEQLKQDSTASQASSHGDIVPPKAEGPH